MVNEIAADGLQQTRASHFTTHSDTAHIIIIIIKALPAYDDFMYTTQITNRVIISMINIFTYHTMYTIQPYCL